MNYRCACCDVFNKKIFDYVDYEKGHPAPVCEFCFNQIEHSKYKTIKGFKRNCELVIIRDVGKPRHNEKVKVKKSVSLDPDKVEKILRHYPNLSSGLDEIIKEWINSH